MVHEEYGVGRFVGLQSLAVAGMRNEFLTLEFCREHNMFSFGYNQESGNYEISSTRVADKMLAMDRSIPGEK